MNDTLSKKISFAQMIFCIMIVFGHALDFDLINQFRNQSFYGNITFYILYIFNVLCGAAVPSYFVMSGYLFFYKNTEGGYLRKIQSRFRSILIPYVLWNLIGYFVCAIFANGTLVNIGLAIINSSYNGSLWYMRNLIIYIAASPLIIPCVKRKKVCLMFIVCLVLINLIFYNRLSYYSYSYGMIYYAIGGYLALHSQEKVLKKPELKEIICAIIISGVVFILAVKTQILTVNVGRLVVNITWCMSVFILCDWWIRLKVNKRFPSLFYVYCGHGPVFALITEAILKPLEIKEVGCLMVVKFLVMPITAITLLYFVQVELKKHSLVIYKLFGGR